MTASPPVPPAECSRPRHRGGGLENLGDGRGGKRFGYQVSLAYRAQRIVGLGASPYMASGLKVFSVSVKSSSCVLARSAPTGTRR